MYSKVFLEITNVCNLRCSFCPGTRRRPRFLSPEEFRILAAKLRPVTDYLHLHVMGEPLLHPQLAEILELSHALGFQINLTTNGTLLERQQDILLNAPALRRVNVSLHSFEANECGDFDGYLRACAGFGREAAGRGKLVSYRLWNLDGAATRGLHEKNDAILAALHRAFPNPWRKNTWGWRLDDTVYINCGDRFDWPTMDAPERGERGRCRALTGQLAVLCDGTAVPCCLDGEGRMALGNLFTQDLEDILASPLARTVTQGFQNGMRAHPLCRRCGYIDRFRQHFG